VVRSSCCRSGDFDAALGAMAQLVARLVRNEKARGSNPLSSTRVKSRLTSNVRRDFCCCGPGWATNVRGPGWLHRLRNRFGLPPARRGSRAAPQRRHRRPAGRHDVRVPQSGGRWPRRGPQRLRAQARHHRPRRPFEAVLTRTLASAFKWANAVGSCQPRTGPGIRRLADNARSDQSTSADRGIPGAREAIRRSRRGLPGGSTSLRAAV
jgi:hypothetical protein